MIDVFHAILSKPMLSIIITYKRIETIMAYLKYQIFLD